eukprot:c25859_g1_i1 orf=409-1956(-)
MKASLKFRDDEVPLFRGKLPLTVAGVQLLSGITVGNSQDLTIQLGTFFDAGPSCKLAYKPNDKESSFSLILKTGFGLWGSPNAAPLAMTAEFNLWGRAGPFFSIHVKPRVGDFSVRKKASSFPSCSSESSPEYTNPVFVDSGLSSNGSTLVTLDKGILCTPPLNGDVYTPMHKGRSFSNGSLTTFPAVRNRNSTSDSNLVIGSNFSFRIEGLDREKKSREGKQKVEGLKEPDSGLLVDAPIDPFQEEGRVQVGALEIGERREHMATVRPVGFHGSLNGWTANTHSSVPLGKYAKLNIRWGVKVPSDLFQSFSSNISGFRASKLMVLVDKISIERVNAGTNKKLQKNLRLDTLTCPVECQLVPYEITEDSHELAQVAGLCSTMKRHLQLLNSENKVLRRTMEDMRDELEFRGGVGSWKLARPGTEILIQEDSTAIPDNLDYPQKDNRKDAHQRDNEGKRDGRSGSRKELPSESVGVRYSPGKEVPSEMVFPPSGGSQSLVLDELKKATSAFESRSE